jgi:predicted small metal-binding protein
MSSADGDPHVKFALLSRVHTVNSRCYWFSGGSDTVTLKAVLDTLFILRPTNESPEVGKDWPGCGWGVDGDEDDVVVDGAVEDVGVVDDVAEGARRDWLMKCCWVARVSPSAEIMRTGNLEKGGGQRQRDSWTCTLGWQLGLASSSVRQ